MLSDGLYTLLETSEKMFVVHLSDKAHPVFKAHFPSNPILPGFMMVEILAQILEIKIDKIAKAKFISPVFPNDKLVYELKEKKVEILKNEKKVAEIIYGQK